MAYRLFFLSTLFCFYQSNAVQETIEIINNTNGSVQVSHPVSKYVKATISFSNIEQKASDEYLIIALPESFLSTDDGHSLNNSGQIAGFIREKQVTSTTQIPRNNARNRWRSPLKMPSEKSDGCYAAVWSLTDGLKVSELKNSRAVALNDHGYVAVSRGADLPHPDVLWDLDTDEFQNNPKWTEKENVGKRRIKVSTFNHMRSVLDINECRSELEIKNNFIGSNNDPELYLTNSGKYRVIAFQSHLYVNQKRLKTVLPAVNARLNDKDNVVALVNVCGKQAIGSWGKKEGATVSACLQDNPHFKGYTNFAIAGFNNNGQILLRADVGELDQLEHTFVRPRMFLLAPVCKK